MSSNYIPIPIINRMTAILDKVLFDPAGITAAELLRTEDIPKNSIVREFVGGSCFKV